MEEDENVENLSLEYEAQDFADDLDGDETELSPPDEENKAKQLNVTNIVMAIGIALAIIIALIVVAGKVHKKRVKDNSELDKAGNKYIPDIALKEKQIPLIEIEDVGEKKKQSEEDIEDIINSLPEEFQQPAPGKAPISTAGGKSSSYKSDRPDTRNSISIRKIEGIGGQEYTAATNQAIIANAMSGYTAGMANNSPQRMSREEYIAQLMKQSVAASQSVYGNQGGGNQNSKESFYGNSNGLAGQ